MGDMERIARGEVSVEEADRLIKEGLSSGEEIAKVYSIYQRLTWLMMCERRRDEELRLWHRTICQTAQIIRQQGASNALDIASRIDGLADLIKISVGMSDGPTRGEIIQDSPETKILDRLSIIREYVPRSDLEREFDIRPSSLSRILTSLVFNGLIERDPGSPEPRYRSC